MRRVWTSTTWDETGLATPTMSCVSKHRTWRVPSAYVNGRPVSKAGVPDAKALEARMRISCPEGEQADAGNRTSDLLIAVRRPLWPFWLCEANSSHLNAAVSRPCHAAKRKLFLRSLPSERSPRASPRPRNDTKTQLEFGTRAKKIDQRKPQAGPQTLALPSSGEESRFRSRVFPAAGHMPEADSNPHGHSPTVFRPKGPPFLGCFYAQEPLIVSDRWAPRPPPLPCSTVWCEHRAT